MEQAQEKPMPKPNKPAWRKRASCLIFNVSTQQLLLVSSRRHSTDTNKSWIIPGGSIEETDDSPQACAMRECEEESGIVPDGNCMAYLGEFIDPDRRTKTDTFAASRFVPGRPSVENRTHYWCPFLEVERHLAWRPTLLRMFESSRGFLQHFVDEQKQHQEGVATATTTAAQ
ncbi:hypothetical protein PAPYR_3430 [Paratrimastix pyriformis]|uniref:Nudix hydrolase domain-containing protein n=1 Tax=Paratrimastix pyriformis TaxID=342808 RepID=A0ABQ8USA1_9EUKA|nr:hypothetical protein PAPYR_3430 [Paratrimastix pyriformis]